MSLGTLVVLLLAGSAFQYFALGRVLRSDEASFLNQHYNQTLSDGAALRRPIRACVLNATSRLQAVSAGQITAPYAACIARALAPDGNNQFTAAVLATDGGVIAPSTADPAYSELPTLPVRDYLNVATGKQPQAYYLSGDGGAQQIVILRALRVSGRIVGVAQFGESTARLQAIQGSLLTVLGIATGILMLLALVIIPLVVARALRPLHRVTEASAALAAGDLGRRVDEPRTRDEVGTLSRAFNRMASAVQSAFAVREQNEAGMRRFVGDASHELRTPLTTIQGRLDMLMRGAADDPATREASFAAMQREVGRMAGLVEDLLTLTRIDATPERQAKQHSAVDIDGLVSDTIEEQSVRAPQQRVEVDVTAPGQAIVVGDREQLRRVILNLANNAVAYAPGGIHRWRTGVDGDTVVVSLADQGPGIPEDDRGRIFDRFYRRSPQQGSPAGGSGLGLAIVRSIVEAHGGAVEVDTNLSQGATFTVRLPRAS